MSFEPIARLIVWRTLSTGERAQVGVLTQDRWGVFFQYSDDYLHRFGNLSPLQMSADSNLQQAPQTPHDGLHGVFADSLPDGWGLLLQNRIYRQQDIAPHQISAMDRLALIGQRGMGALSFDPATHSFDDLADTDVATLGLQAQSIFDQSVSRFMDEDHAETLLARLVAVGAIGGARPKAQIYMPEGDISRCRIMGKPQDEGWLVKFTSNKLALGHEESLCEAAYLQMALDAQCQPPSWQLIDAPKESEAIAWLCVKRFDYLPNATQSGRYHMHSACGLLGADFRMPSLDYEDLIKVSRHLCKSTAAGRLLFRRAVFNLYAANQDDHSKNWSFLQLDNGQWQPSAFYDVTFSPHRFNGHATAFCGYGKAPPSAVMQKLAAGAGFDSWQQAQHCVAEVVDALGQFTQHAKSLGVSKSRVDEISKVLNERRQQNAALLAR